MNRTLALALSYLFHPALMPLLGVAVVLLLSPHYISRPLFLVVMLYVFLGTYVFPLLLALVLKRMGLLSSLQMEFASERRLPYITAALFYFMTAHSLRTYPIPPAATYFLLVGVVILAISLALLSFTKLSIHMAGLGALLGLIVFLSTYYAVDMVLPIALLILLAGLVGTARLFLQAHKPMEVYLGFLLGFGSAMGVIYGFG